MSIYFARRVAIIFLLTLAVFLLYTVDKKIYSIYIFFLFIDLEPSKWSSTNHELPKNQMITQFLISTGYSQIT